MCEVFIIENTKNAWFINQKVSLKSTKKGDLMLTTLILMLDFQAINLQILGGGMAPLLSRGCHEGTGKITFMYSYT